MKKTRKERFSLAKLAKNLDNMLKERKKLYDERDENEKQIHSLNNKIHLVEAWQALERELQGLDNLGPSLSTSMCFGKQQNEVKKPRKYKRRKKNVKR